jgi:putative oxidoreductase
MRIASIVSRYPSGLMFTVFGLNGFLHFIHQGPPPSPIAIRFLTAMSVAHYMTVVFLVELAGGVLLLSGRFVPLAIAILAPVIVNILNYHITMDPGGIGPGVLATILWLFLCIRFRSSFSGLFQTVRQGG